MSINRRLRRNNNLAGLRAQLDDKEQEIFRLSQNMDMQGMYFKEITKVTTALKDMLMKETGLDEKTLMDKVDEHLAAVEAEELDAEMKSEGSTEVQNEDVTEIDTDSTEMDQAIEFTSEPEDIEETIADVEEKPKKKATPKAKAKPAEDAPKKPNKPRKKKEDKE